MDLLFPGARSRRSVGGAGVGTEGDGSWALSAPVLEADRPDSPTCWLCDLGQLF